MSDINSIFDIALQQAGSVRLDSIILNDDEYQQLLAASNDATDKCSEIAPDEEARALIDDMLTAQSACTSYYTAAAYRQGYIDCIALLKELGAF